jgi:hypothetical protein
MYGDQIWPSIFESLPYSIAKDAMHSEALGKDSCGHFFVSNFFCQMIRLLYLYVKVILLCCTVIFEINKA